jgi:hypothetical protein
MIEDEVEAGEAGWINTQLKMEEMSLTMDATRFYD